MQIKAKFSAGFYEEESREIRVPPDKKRLWAVLLDLLLEFDRVCRENGIKYMIDGGTLLGAVRHGGFIPWDDDIDVIMLREEYDKLNKIASEKFSSPYFWQTYKTDRDHGRGFARLRNSSTTYIPRYEMEGDKPIFKHNQGVLIDVFVCDNVPDDDGVRAKFLDRLYSVQSDVWRMRAQVRRKWTLGLFLRLPELIRKIRYETLCRCLGIESVEKKVGVLDKMAQEYNEIKTRCVSHLTYCSDRKERLCILFPRYFLEDLTGIEFEGYKFPATRHADEYLTLVYGNWRKHVVASNAPGGIFIDLDNSYTKYVKD